MEVDEIRDSWPSLLISLGTVQSLDRADQLFSMDDPTSEIGFILEGQISAQVYSENGQETWVGQFGVGDFIGYTSYFIGKPRTFEAVSDTPVQIVTLQSHIFEKLLIQNHDLQTLIYKDMSRRLDDMTQRLIEAVTLSAPGRVCAELKRIATPIGRNPVTQIIRPNPVFVDVARRISSTRETVSRTVSRMCDLGVLSRTTGAIIINDMEQLQRYIR